MAEEEGLLQSGLKPRTVDSRAWSIYTDEILLRESRVPIASLVIVARTSGGVELGRVEYGEEPGKDGKPSGYDSWTFFEGGGSVTLPYVIHEGMLYVGLVRQFRNCERHPIYNVEGFIENAPRGSHDFQCPPGDTAAEELREEVGSVVGEIVRLPGSNVNCNNAWYTYRDEKNGNGFPIAQGGVTFYAVEVCLDQLEMGEDWRLRVSAAVQSGRPVGSPYEMIDRCEFLRWDEAVKVRDGFAAIAVARLLAHLVATGAASIGF